MSNPPVFFVVARASNGVIGNKGKLPWHISQDLKHFKAMTGHNPMLMGRKTFEGLPGLLPGRRHLVLTRDLDWSAAGAEVVHSPQQAFDLVQLSDRLAVIGGAEIFALMEQYAYKVHLTEIFLEPEGDTFLPPFDPSIWREVARLDRPAMNGDPAYSFVTLRRVQA